MVMRPDGGNEWKLLALGTALGAWWVLMAGAALGFGAGSVKILRALGSFLHWEGAQGL